MRSRAFDFQSANISAGNDLINIGNDPIWRHKPQQDITLGHGKVSVFRNMKLSNTSLAVVSWTF